MLFLFITCFAKHIILVYLPSSQATKQLNFTEYLFFNLIYIHYICFLFLRYKLASGSRCFETISLYNISWILSPLKFDCIFENAWSCSPYFWEEILSSDESRWAPPTLVTRCYVPHFYYYCDISIEILQIKKLFTCEWDILTKLILGTA